MSSFFKALLNKISYNHNCLRKVLVIIMKNNKYSLYRLMQIYMNDPLAGARFFYNIKWPQGFHCQECSCSTYKYDESTQTFICTECGHRESLLEHTVFSKCQDDPNSLVLGLYLCLANKHRISRKELGQLVNIPTESASALIKNTEMIDECNIKEEIIRKMFEDVQTPLLNKMSYHENNTSNHVIIPTKAG